MMVMMTSILGFFFLRSFLKNGNPARWKMGTRGVCPATYRITAWHCPFPFPFPWLPTWKVVGIILVLYVENTDSRVDDRLVLVREGRRRQRRRDSNSYRCGPLFCPYVPVTLLVPRGTGGGTGCRFGVTPRLEDDGSGGGSQCFLRRRSAAVLRAMVVTENKKYGRLW
jgi:hypothetical protein